MTKSLEQIIEFVVSALADWRVLRVVATIIVAAVPCVVSAQTPVQQIPPSAAPPSDPPPDVFRESQFYGCWKHAGVRPVANQWTGYSILCFRNDRTVHYGYISPEHGGEDLFEWRFIPNDTLSIDEQSCDIWPGTTTENLFLGRCLYVGLWIRQCVRMNEEGTDCPGDRAPSATRQTPPSATARPAQPSVHFQESQFYGCWKLTGSRLTANQSAGFSIMCFRNDQTVYYFFISPEHGGEDLFKWRFVPNGKLIIDGQTCRIMPGNNAENLLLERCVFMGAWVQQCARTNKEGTACPRNQ